MRIERDLPEGSNVIVADLKYVALTISHLARQVTLKLEHRIHPDLDFVEPHLGQNNGGQLQSIVQTISG